MADATDRKVSLSRPVLRDAPPRLAWRGSVAVFGRGAGAFAERLCARLVELGVRARLLRVELRHGEGHDLGSERLDTHPRSLPAALEAARAASGDAITVGVGLAFAAGVESDLTVWIRAGESLLTLAPLERSLSREADLVLEDARLSTAESLAERLRTWAPQATLVGGAEGT